jgi:hypothetical protein
MQGKKCLICDTVLINSKYPGILYCPQCKFLTSDLELSEDELKAIYTQNYFKGEEYWDYIQDKLIIQKNLFSRKNLLYRHLDKPLNKLNIFEIGCAFGYFLELVETDFNSATGIDISADVIEYNKANQNLDINCGDFLDYNLRIKYDVFCLWDTIEHLKSPELYIKKISENINENGYIAITTGDIGSVNARVQGKRWRQIHPPSHLHYFSKNNITQLLSNYGFKAVYFGRPGSFHSIDNILYGYFVLRKQKPEIYNFFKTKIKLNLNIYINLFDLMFIVAKKF